MPNIWTHLIFGRKILEQLGQERLVQSPYSARVFNLGCQGPDFLFYHHFLPWKKGKHMSQLGSILHKEHCGPALLEMLNTMKQQGRSLDDPAVIYVLGFIAHHVLDRNMHPYINYKSGFVKWNHQRFEIILDTIMVRKHLNLETWKTPVWKEIDIGPYFPDGIVDMFETIIRQYFPQLAEGIQKSEWNEAYREMIQAQKLFHDPYGFKRLLTARQIEPLVYKKKNAPLDYVNEARLQWNDPTSLEEKHTFSVWDLWDQALEDGKAVLTEAMKYLETGSEYKLGSDQGRLEPPAYSDAASSYAALKERIGNHSYETGKPCDSGLETKYVKPIL